MDDGINSISGIRSAANVLTLIGAILQTIICTGIIIVTVGIGTVVAVPLIVLAWVAYNKTKRFEKGWNIYGIVQSVCLCDMVGLSGYILALVDFSNTEREAAFKQHAQTPGNANSVQNKNGAEIKDELNKVQDEIATLKAELQKGE